MTNRRRSEDFFLNFVVFLGRKSELLYDGTKKTKNEHNYGSSMPNTRISELHHISYGEHFLPGITGTKSTCIWRVYYT